MKATVEGDKAIRENFRALAKRYPIAAAGALYKLGVAILNDALPRTPVEFGVLRTSGYVSPPSGSGADADVEVGFGTVYAVPQHERMDYKHPRGGGPKFLERAVASLSPRAMMLLGKWTEELQKRGAGYAQAPGVAPRPQVGNSNRKKRSQGARLKRAARNVRRRTGR